MRARYIAALRSGLGAVVPIVGRSAAPRAQAQVEVRYRWIRQRSSNFFTRGYISSRRAGREDLCKEVATQFVQLRVEQRGRLMSQWASVQSENHSYYHCWARV